MTSPSALSQAPPTNCGLVDLSCQATTAVGSVVESFVQQIANAAADLVVTTSTWWLDTDSVDPEDSAVVAAQGVTHYVVIVMLISSMLFQSIRLVVSRKAEPLAMVASGLVRYAIAAGLGLTLMQAALRAGDVLSSALLDDAASSFAHLMKTILTTDAQNGGLIVAVFSVLALVLSIIQWAMMALRQAGLLVIAAMIPLAASGSLNRATRPWLDRLICWALAMIVYKPAGALIYFIGFRYLSSRSIDADSSISTSLSGLMVLLLAVIAMPATLKFFTWSGVQVSGGSGSGSGFLGAAGAIAMSDGHQRAAAARAGDSTGPGSQPMRGGPVPTGAAASPQSGSVAGVGPAGAAVASAMATRTAARAAVRRAASEMSGPSDGES